MCAKVEHAHTRNTHTQYHASKQILYTLPPPGPLLVPLWLIDAPTCCCGTKTIRLVDHVLPQTYLNGTSRCLLLGNYIQEYEIYTIKYWLRNVKLMGSINLFDMYLEGAFDRRQLDSSFCLDTDSSHSPTYLIPHEFLQSCLLTPSVL